MRFFNRRGAFFEYEWLSVVDRGLFRLVVLQLWKSKAAGFHGPVQVQNCRHLNSPEIDGTRNIRAS
jgi:hypothetical protein